jgi:hypothetical protein
MIETRPKIIRGYMNKSIMNHIKFIKYAKIRKERKNGFLIETTL